MSDEIKKNNVVIEVPKNKDNVFVRPENEIPFELEQDRYVEQRKFVEANKNRIPFQDQIKKDMAKEDELYSSVFNVIEKFKNPKVASANILRKFRTPENFLENIKEKQKLDFSKIEDVRKATEELNAYRNLMVDEYERKFSDTFFYAKKVFGADDETAKKLAEDRVIRWDNNFFESAYKKVYDSAIQNGAIKDDINIKTPEVSLVIDAINKTKIAEDAGGFIKTERDERGMPVVYAVDATGEKIKKENAMVIDKGYSNLFFNSFLEKVRKDAMTMFVNSGFNEDEKALDNISKSVVLNNFLEASKKYFNNDIDKARVSLAVGSGKKYDNVNKFFDEVVGLINNDLKGNIQRLKSLDDAIDEFSNIAREYLKFNLRKIIGFNDKIDKDTGEVIYGQLSNEKIRNIANYYYNKIVDENNNIDEGKLEELILDDFVKSHPDNMRDTIKNMLKNNIDDIVLQVGGAIQAKVNKNKEELDKYFRNIIRQEELMKFRYKLTNSQIGNSFVIASGDTAENTANILKSIVIDDKGKLDKGILDNYIDYEVVNNGESQAIKINPYGRAEGENYVYTKRDAISESVLSVARIYNSKIKNGNVISEDNLDFTRFDKNTFDIALYLVSNGYDTQDNFFRSYIENVNNIKDYVKSFPGKKNIDFISFALGQKKKKNVYVGFKKLPDDIYNAITSNIIEKEKAKAYLGENKRKTALFKSFVSLYGHAIDNNLDKIEEYKSYIKNAANNKKLQIFLDTNPIAKNVWNNVDSDNVKAFILAYADEMID